MKKNDNYAIPKLLRLNVYYAYNVVYQLFKETRLS